MSFVGSVNDCDQSTIVTKLFANPLLFVKTHHSSQVGVCIAHKTSTTQYSALPNDRISTPGLICDLLVGFLEQIRVVGNPPTSNPGLQRAVKERIPGVSHPREIDSGFRTLLQLPVHRKSAVMS